MKGIFAKLTAIYKIPFKVNIPPEKTCNPFTKSADVTRESTCKSIKRYHYPWSVLYNE